MKIVHYEYRLKAFTKEGEIGVELVAKPIKHYSDVEEFLPSGDLMPVKYPRKRRTGQITARYYFGISTKDIKPASEPGFIKTNSDHNKNKRSRESWSTSLRK